MSRGPGRIERAIRALFDANPDEAFTTDELCRHCYDLGARFPERSHRIAVIRAARGVLKDDPDWRCSRGRGQMLIYYSATSLPGTAMTEVLGGAGSHYLSSRELRREVRAILNPADDDDRAWRLDQKARAERAVAKHGGMGPPKSGSL